MREDGKVVFFEAAACLSRRSEACVTVVAGVMASRRPDKGLFRVQSFGAATAVSPLDAEAAEEVEGLGATAAVGMAGLEAEEAACLVVSRRRFHMGAGPAVGEDAAAAGA